MKIRKRYLTFFVMCFLGAGCTDFVQERQLADANLRSFEGQPIQNLKAKLGEPDNKSNTANGYVYKWTSSRDMSEAIYTQGMMSANGKQVNYNPDSGALIKHEACTIATLTDFNNIIIKSRFSGSATGACITTFDKLKSTDKQPIYPVFP